MSRTFLSVPELSNKIIRSGLFSIAARGYHSSIEDFNFSDKFKLAIAKKVEPIAQEFSEHRALKHPLFVYLAQQSKEGFTPTQFLIYRDNFFRRTQLTIPSIAATFQAAVTYEDFDAALLALRNLNDEMGKGNKKDFHPHLLLESHNLHGIRVFELDPLPRISAAEKSELLVPEVEEYRQAKKAIFTRPYPFIAGNTWAHEFAANSMLDHFKEAFFVPYLGFYTEKEAEEIMRFFTVHKDELHEGGDIEQQHQEMAREAVELACRHSLSNLSQVREGGVIFLEHQAKLWDGMLRELEKAREVGEIVVPKSLAIKDAKRPQSTIVKVTSEKVDAENKEAKKFDGARS